MDSSKKDTYCPLLWGEVYIDAKGDVYGCCHKKPAAIGNINENKLEDIYNNDKIRRLRQDSLEGKLACYEQCTIIDKDKERYAPRKASFNYQSDLRKLKIEFGELCNISCVMCWQDHKSRTVLNYQKVIDNIDLSPFDTVDIQGGEPLAITDAKAFYEYASSQGKRPLFMTNGLLINDDWAQKIVFNSDYIHVSLNAATEKTHELVNKGSKWPVVLKNIQRLREARGRLKTPFSIIGHMTIVVQNVHEVSMFIRDFPSLGFDRISFGYDKKVPPYLQTNPLLKVALKHTIKKALAVKDLSLIETKRLKMLELI